MLLLGAILIASDIALSVYAGPVLTPAFGRGIEATMLAALGVLGGSAALLGCYRLLRSFGRQSPHATPN
jgi:hypothetical protein